jgi:hypothetical protein
MIWMFLQWIYPGAAVLFVGKIILSRLKQRDLQGDEDLRQIIREELRRCTTNNAPRTSGTGSST